MLPTTKFGVYSLATSLTLGKTATETGSSQTRLSLSLLALSALSVLKEQGQEEEHSLTCEPLFLFYQFVPHFRSEKKFGQDQIILSESGSSYFLFSLFSRVVKDFRLWVKVEVEEIARRKYLVGLSVSTFLVVDGRK